MTWQSKMLYPALLLTVLLLAGCAATKEPSVVEQVPVKVYFGTHDAENLVAEIHKVKKTDPLMQRSMEILVGGPKNPELVAVVPSTVKVKSVDVKERIVYVNFSEEMVTQRFGGSSREILAVAAIVNTLTEFPEVDAVQILVDGKKVETLFGHMDITEPLGRSSSIIKDK